MEPVSRPGTVCNYIQKDANGDGKVTDEDEKQPIKWRVLSVEEDGTALLLADKLLDMQPFDKNGKNSIFVMFYI